jgi:acyl carrier protein
MRTRDEIFSEVRSVLTKDFGLQPEQITLTAHLVDDLDFDSIDAIDLVVRLDELVGLAVDEEELKSLRTIGDLIELVHRHLGQGES